MRLYGFPYIKAVMLIYCRLKSTAIAYVCDTNSQNPISLHSVLHVPKNSYKNYGYY